MDDYIEFTLANNSYCSLNEGLKKLIKLKEDSDYKYALLSIAQFVELSFKLFIQQIHPLLIYTNVFKTELKIPEENTITFEAAVTFIINDIEHSKNKHGISFGDIKFLKGLRNKLMHSEFKFSKQQIEESMDKALNEMVKLYNYYNLSLEKQIHYSLQKEFLKRVKGYSARLEKAQQDILQLVDNFNMLHNKDIENDYRAACRAECPNCFNNTFFINCEKQKGNCTFCNYADDTNICAECEDWFPYSELRGYYRNKSICEQCVERMRDKWEPDK